MPNANEQLERAYDASWIIGTPNRENCSGFLKSLGKQMGFYVPDKNADGIIAGFEEASKSMVSVWEKIGTGTTALEKASEEAAAGRIVVVAATSKDYGQSNGHVAILLPKRGGPHNAPFIYGGGSAGARSKGTKTIRQVWNPSKHNVLRFFVHRSKMLGDYE